MTDMTNTQLGSFESHESVRRQKLDGDDLLGVSVRQLVGSAPTVPAFPKTALASLDPVPTSTTKRPKRIVAGLVLLLLASLAGAGVAIPRFASQESTPNSMMIMKPLPKGLTLISMTEDPGGAPYVESSYFEYSGPDNDKVWLTISLDRASLEKAVRDAGEVPLRISNSYRDGLPEFNLADGTPAKLVRIPQQDPMFEQLHWTEAGFEFSLQRNEPKERNRPLLALANQMAPAEAKGFATEPRVPPDYKESHRSVSDGKVLKRKASFRATVVNAKGQNYDVYAGFFTPSNLSPVVPQVVGGRTVTISENGISWKDGELQFQAVRLGGELWIPGQPRKPMKVDATLRTLIASTSAGTLASWRKQARRPRTGLQKKGSTEYRGVKLDYYAPSAAWTEDFVCLGPLTIASCQALNGRFDFGSFRLADGRWMVISSVVNLRSELLVAGRQRNADPTKPKRLNTDGLFDVVTIGLSETAITILPADQKFLDLDTGSRIQRPRSPGA
jgi:hypothetical protein